MKNYVAVPAIMLFLMVCSAAVFADQANFSPEPRAQPEPVALTISARDVAVLALENNPDVQMFKFDALRSQTLVMEEESVFDMVLRAGAEYRDDQTKQSSAVFGSQTREQSLDVSLEKKLSTGTDITLSAGDLRTSTNSAFASLNPAREATVGISLRQPLGNNTFGLLDRGRVAITRLNAQNLDQQAATDIEQAVAVALRAYWNLVLAGEEGAIDEDMLARAEELARVTRENKKLGLAEDAEMLATEANVRRRQTALRNQQYIRTRAKYALYRVLFEDDLERDVQPLEQLPREFDEITVADSLRRAIANRRDYRQAKNTVDARQINLSMKKNARWPEIDLEASLVRNGLDTTPDNAWQQMSEEDNPAWQVGVRVSLPLENRKARSQADQARYEKEKALVALKKVEHGIVIDVATAVDGLRNAQETARLQEDVLRLQEEKLAAEEKRFREGRSDTDMLIRYQEDVLEARRTLELARYAWQIALINVKLAEHSLLYEYWPQSEGAGAADTVPEEKP